MSKSLDSLNHSDFVEVLYQKLLSRKSDEDGKRHCLNALKRGLSRLWVVDAFFE
ncbi:MAG: DUF4214 domain-containing protein [Candidatus Hodarchaeota archaeon]